MNDSQAVQQKRASDYRALLPVQKTMVQIMAVNIDNCRLYAMLSCLGDLGITDEKGKVFNTNNIQPLQNELIDKGLLLKSGKGICCPDSIRQIAVRDSLEEGSFSRLAQVVAKNMKHPDLSKPMAFSWMNPYENIQQLLGSLQIALFTCDSIDEIRKIFEFVNKFFREGYLDAGVLDQILNQPFSEDIINYIHPEIRFEVLLALISEVDLFLKPSSIILEYLRKNNLIESRKSSESISLVYHFLTSGDLKSARSVLNHLDGNEQPEKFSYQGWLEFVSGHYREAYASFSEAIKGIKKVTGKRKVFLQSYTGIFHLLTLLQFDELRYREEALDYISIAEKNSYSLLYLMEGLKVVFDKQGGLPLHGSFPRTFIAFNIPALSLFIHALVNFWIVKTKTTELTSRLQDTRDKAMAGGYFWLAAEFSALLAQLGDEKAKNSEIASRLHSKCKTVSCVGIMTEKPEWEKILQALLQVKGKKETLPTAERSGQRLIWLFSFNERYNYSYLTPRLQKMGKNGQWTKGRPVALKTLYHDYHTMEGLSEQDRRVCQSIKETYYRSGWKQYGNTEYVISESAALPALVGHPFLFLQDSPEARVELVNAEPEMTVQEKNGRLKLTMSPVPKESQNDFVIVKDTPTRFKLVRFTAEQTQVSEYLKKGVTVPKSGEKLVRQVVDSLASVLPVQSDFSSRDAAIETVEADSRPHAHVIPFQDGIKVEFLVRPLPDGSSSFRPGKGGRNVVAEIEGKKLQALRDLAGEKKALDRIIETCPTLGKIESLENEWLAGDAEDALELLLELKQCGDEVVLRWPQGEKMKVRREVSFSSFSLRIEKDRDWFKAGGSLAVDDSLLLDLRTLLNLLERSTGRFVQLDDGTFLAVTGHLRKRLDELRAYSDGHGKGVRFSPLASLALSGLIDEVGDLQSDKAWKEHCRNLEEVIRPELPSTLQGSLRDYQTAGFQWLAQLSHWGMGGCLADDMGLGKTVQALAAILLRAGRGPTLVVAPLSVISNWQEEARRFAPTLNVTIFGPGDRKKTVEELQPFDLLVVSYGLLPLEEELLSSVKWQTVVLDEAQAIKNAQTKRSQAAMKLQAEFRVITTGTPVENHLGELWTLFHFLNPGLLGSLKKFNEKFGAPIERDNDHEAGRKLRKLIRPFILRRLKSDVLQELPPKTEIVLNVEMSPEEALLYEAQRLQSLENIGRHEEDSPGQKHLRILGEIMKLRRLCCNPELVLPDCNIAGSKLKVFGDTLHELLANNHKALVFSQFVDHLQIIRNYLEKQGVSYQYLDGSTPLKQRKERIADFQNGSGDVFLISLKAGGTGLNLTAADYVIHMDPWWNPAVEDQASDRAHRMGQDRPVTVYRLVVKDTIEEQIVQLHKQKRDLADSLLEGSDAAARISAEELLALLQIH